MSMNIRIPRRLLAAVLVLGILSSDPVLAGKGGGGKPPADPPPPAALIPVKVILMAGQSNMGGRGVDADLATLAPELQTPQTDVRIFHQGGWNDLQPGLGDLADSFGPELAFGRDMADALPNDNIALIKYSSGGTNLADDWNPNTQGSMWTGFVNSVNSALATLDPQVYAPQIVGMVWMQGERDSKFEDMALAYEQNLTNFIQAVRVQFNSPDLPFIIGQIHSKNTGEFKYVIQDAQMNVWLNVPNTGFVYTDDLSLHDDLLHYNSVGTLDLGARFASELLTFPLSFPPIWVDTVNYTITGRKKKSLVVTVAIDDEIGPLGGASVSLTLLHESGSSWTYTGTTASDGTASFTLSNAPVGCYDTIVTDVHAGIYDWDGATPVNKFCW
jgi:hypothetical protein